MISTASRRRFSGVSGTTANSGGRIAAIRAVTARMYAADKDLPLALAKKPAETVKKSPIAAAAPSRTPAPQACAKPPAAAAQPRKPGRVETVALAVRTNPKLKGMEDIALHMLDEDRDLKGVSGDGIVKLMLRVDPTTYRAEMAERERQATRARSGAVWDRAIAAVCGGSEKPAAKSKAASQQREDPWDKAIAAIYGRYGR